MASEFDIPKGLRLHMAYDVPMGQTPVFNLTCTFGRTLDESAFLISIPMVGGVSLSLDEKQKFLIRYTQGSENRILAAYADDIVKDGIRRYWKMRRVSEARQFFQRRDERYKVTLHATYSQPTWPVNAEGFITPENAMTLDISAGGLSIFLSDRYDVGEILNITLPRVGITPEGAQIADIVAVVSWVREAPKGSPFRFISGLQFRFGEGVQREQMVNYVGNLKRVYKL